MRITLFDHQTTREILEDDLPATLSSSQMVWVDMTGPTKDDVRVMRDVFKFHPLAIEDTHNQSQRPKIEEFSDYLFGILNPIEVTDGDLSFRELDVFVGRNYIVTVHPGSEPIIQEAEHRIGHHITTPLLSPGYLLYVLVDVVVDHYFPLLDSLGDDIEQLGDNIVTQARQESLNRLFNLKRTLNTLWKVIGPQRDMFNVLTRRDLPFIDQNVLQYYLRDVYDHLLRITDTVNTYRDVLTSVIDLYMSAVSNRLNQVVNRLTVITIIIGVFSVIGSFYGMNFEHTWPPFPALWGVPFVLGMMALATVVVLAIFRRLGWY
jgi:magnesium transporter